jgi:hypothetical protein
MVLDPRKDLTNYNRRKWVRAGDIRRDTGCIPMVPPGGSTSTRRSWEVVGPLDLVGDRPEGMLSRNRAEGHLRMGEVRFGSCCNPLHRMNSRRRRDGGGWDCHPRHNLDRQVRSERDCRLAPDANSSVWSKRGSKTSREWSCSCSEQ